MRHSLFSKTAALAVVAPAFLAPAIVRAQEPKVTSGRTAGTFTATLEGADKPFEAKLYADEATKLTLYLGKDVFSLTRDPPAGDLLKGTIKAGNIVGGLNGNGAQTATIEIKIDARDKFSGRVVRNGVVSKLTLTRALEIPISTAEMKDFDAGPPPAFKELFDRSPKPSQFKPELAAAFWDDFGATFYRGRLDGTAKVICVASDPGITEIVVKRSLIGHAGQRVQGFLSKLGLTRSYVLVNAHNVLLHPTQASKGPRIMKDPLMKAWRNEFYDKLVAASGSKLQAIIVFGEQAKVAFDLWPNKPTTVPIFYLPHPTAQDGQLLVNEWRKAIPEIRKVVTPDPDGSNKGPNYGYQIQETDYVRVPRRDLPKGTPAWVGDDSWGRFGSPVHVNPFDKVAGDPKSVWFYSPGANGTTTKTKIHPGDTLPGSF